MSENMIFEGRNERDAIQKAVAELGSESFDVEIIEKTGGLFGFGKVKIRVKALDSIPSHMSGAERGELDKKSRSRKKASNKARRGKKNKVVEEKQKKQEKTEEKDIPVPPGAINQEHIQKTIYFIENIIRKMNLGASIIHGETEGKRVKFDIETEDSNRIIGRKGRNLDSLQILANVYFHKIGSDNKYWRIILDVEGYRMRREETLIRQALRAADHALRTQKSYLLEPMNPFERHLVHKAIGDMEDITTNSEGEGHYKKIRIILKEEAKKKSRRSLR